MEEKQGTAEVKKKRKHVSKKTKRSWRKHTDIKDIEDHLDEVRRQERLGGVLALKKNDQLFFVDKDTANNKTGTGDIEDQVQSKSQKICAKVFIEPCVEPIIGRKHKTNESKLKKSKESKSDESSEDDEEDLKRTLIVNRNAEKKAKAYYDLWNSNDIKNSETVGNLHYLKSTRKFRVKQPKTAYKVRGKAPAVAVCHPGASYNPTLEDHQSLLTTACQVEILKEKEIQKLQRKLQLPPEEELAKLPSWEEEMSQGLFDDESENSEGEQDSNNADVEEENGTLPFSKTKSRKTAKEKRKEKERKDQEQSTRLLRKEKSKENDVFRVKSFKKQIREAEEETKQRRDKKHTKETEASFKPQRLGRHKFEEMNIEIQLTDELSGSLRRLQPEGNLFLDRFKSLQRRNIIEPRIPVAPHRKYKLKEYQKRSYKNYDLQEQLKEKRRKTAET